jgi:3-oxoacyl-[acyl-carrier protein] reductase
MDLGIKGKTAIVTAASRGIGRACALTLAKEGANVMMCARGGAELEEAATAIRTATGARVVAQTADMTNSADLDRLVDRAMAEFGRIDILVAIGGAPQRGRFEEVSVEHLRAGFEMTVLPIFRLVTAVLPGMRKNGWGRIVTVQARSVREPIPAMTVSNATRPGAAGLMKSLAHEFAKDGVLLNTVLPGRILTDRFRQGAEGSTLSNADYIQKESQELPIGRLGDAQEVANAVAFLASEGASYINGVTLAVDGGLIRSI